MPSTNTTCGGQQSGSWLALASPGSDGSVSTSHRILLAVFCVLSAYNGFEIIMMVFLTFKRYRGAYFWSLIASASGVVVMSVTTLLDSETKVGRRSRSNVYAMTVAAVRLVGWSLMVTGQAFVLWSRLHLVLHGRLADRILQSTKWMILVDAVLLHVSASTMAFLAETKEKRSKAFHEGYSTLLKVEVTWFFVQETILSSIYIWGAAKMLRALLPAVQEPEKFWDRNSVVLKWLIAINAVIILMDLALVLLQGLSQFGIQTLLKILIYAIKLKLEFAILRKLKKCVDREGSFSTGSSTVVAPVPRQDLEMNGTAALDVGGLLESCSKSGSPQNMERKDSAHGNIMIPARTGSLAGLRGRDIEYDLARFRHVENIRTLE